MAAHDRNPLDSSPPEPRRPLPLASPPALTATPDALALLKALRRRWVLALTLGVLVAFRYRPRRTR